MSDDFMTDAPLSARKKLIYPLAVINRPIPNVGIFDEPTRCYKINKQWARLIMGFVSLLAEPELWQDAENDLYQPVQEILKFLEGSDCGMNCEELQDCLENSPVIININNQISNLQDYIQYGDTTIDINNTTVPDIFLPADQNEVIGGDMPAPPPGEDCNKDAVWGAINSLVDYINATNIDFLQNVAQATNVAAQAERAIAAVPIVGILPYDEIIGLADWYSNEAYSEYLATVDELLLQQTKCDLFCLATTGGRCGLNYADLINYFSAKVPPSAGQFADTLANIIQFALLGSFSGDDYFYYMCYFQLAVAAIGEKFFNTRGKETYALYAAAGKNSPDSDWQIFCDECSDGYTYIEYDFAISNHGFVGTNCNYVPGVGWEGVELDPDPDGISSNNMYINKSFVSVLPKSVAMGYVIDAIVDCGVSLQSIGAELNGNNAVHSQIGGLSTGNDQHRAYSQITATWNLFYCGLQGSLCTGQPALTRIKKCRVWLAPDSPIRGVPTDTVPQGLPPNGSTSIVYWE